MLQNITTVDKYVFKFDVMFDDAKITLESSVITQDLTQYKLQDNHYKLDYFFFFRVLDPGNCKISGLDVFRQGDADS